MGEEKNAIQNLEKGLKIQADSGTLLMLSTLYANSCMAYYTLNRFELARKFAEMAIELYNFIALLNNFPFDCGFYLPVFLLLQTHYWHAAS